MTNLNDEGEDLILALSNIRKCLIFKGFMVKFSQIPELLSVSKVMSKDHRQKKNT